MAIFFYQNESNLILARIDLFNGLRFKYSTRITIDKKYWTKKKKGKKLKNPRVQGSHDTHIALNKILDDIERHVKGLDFEYRAGTKKFDSDEPKEMISEFKAELNELLGYKKIQTAEKFDLFKLFDLYAKGKRKKADGKPLSELTQKNVESVKIILSKYKSRIAISDITQGFYNSLYAYFEENGRTDAYFGKNIAVLKAVLNWGFKKHPEFFKGITKQYWKDEDFHTMKEETEDIALSEDKILKLYEKKFKDKEHEQIRDLFYVMCWTGLRFSDLMRIGKNDISNGNLYVKSQKTNTKTRIPFHEHLPEVFKKYDNQLPKMHNATFNRVLREACKIAGLTDPVSMEVITNGKRERNIKPEYEFISAHTGRRSFCTNSYRRGIKIKDIMAISGHVTEASFLRYIKISQEEHAESYLDQSKRYLDQSKPKMKVV